ncbi:hypothetical protein [Serratia ureilytica]|uniref:hypothetical protein n=1 Tax=Serratia ureilytica TaxID=300181 RepID=UPI0018D96CCA|nr:hypothetical protein [Serratia ureilytica]MBH2514861.1 hypothetical protein [Serratia ureilytica]MBH2529735.1 hypothetical protein [Serratia ureilytica]
MDKIREEFEQWLRSQPHVLNVGVRKSGDYVLKEDQIAWSAWQASRASIVVDVPQACAFNLCDLVSRDDVIKAIRSIGLSIKGE